MSKIRLSETASGSTLQDSLIAGMANRLQSSLVQAAPETPDHFIDYLPLVSPPSYRHDLPHIVRIAELLDRVIAGVVKRFAILMPPRHGKSYLSSVYFPAWYLGRWPDKNIIQIGADDDLARTFSIQARNMLDEHGPSYFGTHLDPKTKSAGFWKTSEGGGLKAAGVGGTIVGFGADVLIVDDYIRNIEAALSETQRQKQYQWFLTTAVDQAVANWSDCDCGNSLAPARLDWLLTA